MDRDRRPLRELQGLGGASHSALYAPLPRLSGIVRAYLSRRTSDSASLSAGARWNYFPPVPACVFVWVLAGHDSRLEVCDRADEIALGRPPVLFSGPHRRPSFSVNPGAVRFFTMLMYPDAVRALAGVDIEAHCGRYIHLWDLFDEDWLRMAEAVFGAVDDAARIRLIEGFLLARRSGTGACLPAPAERWNRLDAWSADVARRADGIRLTPRQSDRRIKAWTGLTLRELRGIGRMEHALIGAQSMRRTGRSWSAIAADAGFADQAHMCREFRRHLGMRPTELARNLGQENCWVLRLWT